MRTIMWLYNCPIHYTWQSKQNNLMVLFWLDWQDSNGKYKECSHYHRQSIKVNQLFRDQGYYVCLLGSTGIASLVLSIVFYSL